MLLKGFDLGVIPKKIEKDLLMFCLFVFLGGKYREMDLDLLFIFLFPCGFLAFRQLICYETFTSLC